MKLWWEVRIATLKEIGRCTSVEKRFTNLCEFIAHFARAHRSGENQAGFLKDFVILKFATRSYDHDAAAEREKIKNRRD